MQRDRKMKMYSRSEVATHNSTDSCWVIINRHVYDVTEFLTKHPGGGKAILLESGQDATEMFKKHHSAQALLKHGMDFLIGQVDPSDPLPPPEKPRPFEVEETKELDVAEQSMVAQLFQGTASLTADILGAGLRVVEGLTTPLCWLDKKIRPVRGFPVRKDGRPTKVAIVGAGCSGLSAAWLFKHTEGFDYTVFEAQKRVGGHAYTFDYEGADGKHIFVDMGFIFAGYYTYANLTEMMDIVGAERVDSELSTLSDVDGYKYATEENICGPKQKAFITKSAREECHRFHAYCERWHENPLWNAITLRQFLDLYGFSEEWRKLILTPQLVLLFIGEKFTFDMPARLIFNMFGGPNKQADLIKGHFCYTIKNGTNNWIQQLVKALGREHIKTNCPVREIRRITENGENKVLVVTDEETQVFDHVLMACNPKATALILKNQSPLEEFLFNQIRQENGSTMILHHDKSFLDQYGDPKNLRNFNYKKRGDAPPEVTGLMHRVSRQEPALPLPILTMNPLRPIEGKILHKKYCVKHEEDLWHLCMTRYVLPHLQGRGNVWFCNSWVNWIGHGSAIDAGMAAAVRLGANYTIKSESARNVYFKMACEDMFGYRFDWETSVRKQIPIVRAAL